MCVMGWGFDRKMRRVLGEILPAVLQSAAIGERGAPSTECKYEDGSRILLFML